MDMPYSTSDSKLPIGQYQPPYGYPYTTRQEESSASHLNPNAWSNHPPTYDEIAYQRNTSTAMHSLDSGGPSSLTKLIAIPATSSKLGSPFLRAYPPALANFSISQDTFLQFLDHLNRVAVASPPVQVLGLAGNIVGMVPLATAQIVGGAVNAAATLTTVAMSKGRVEMLLRQANSDIFGPRGLRAHVAKLEAVAQLAKIPILDSQGKIDKQSSILSPLEDSDDLQSTSVQHRRISTLAPWISPLHVESLPAIETQQNFFSKMHTAASERQRTKEEKKVLKDRGKGNKDWTKDSRKAHEEYEREMRKLAEEEEKIRNKSGRKVDKDLEKINKERQKVTREYEREMSKTDRGRKKDDKEEKALRKILFLVVQRMHE